jgi:hypothetical protein
MDTEDSLLLQGRQQRWLLSFRGNCIRCGWHYFWGTTTSGRQDQSLVGNRLRFEHELVFSSALLPGSSRPGWSAGHCADIDRGSER